MDFVERGTGKCSWTGITCGDDGREEVSIKVEEAIDIEEEIPEAITFPSMMTENVVRLWGVCEVLPGHASMSFMAPKRKLKLRLTILCFVLCCGYQKPFEIYNGI